MTPDLRGADLHESYMGGVQLYLADLSEANLREADLSGANLNSANLSWAKIAKAKLRETDLRKANLRKADLSEALLLDADLRGANLSGANLRRISLYLNEQDYPLSGADFRGADLSGADLTGADLTGANFGFARLRKTDLSGADLNGANLRGADLTGAVVEKARVVRTVFVDVDLREVKGLEALKHAGPSTIGHDVLSRSNGNLPDVFLRGCGLRDWEIESSKLHRRSVGVTDITEVLYRVYELRVGQPLQYHSCFISYASEDESFANRIYDDLQARGVRCWFARHHMRPGRKIHEQIEEAIQFHDKLLLILSRASIGSEWVKEEILNAWTREKQESRTMLFPVSLIAFDDLRGWKCFDSDTGRDVAREIRQYFIPNFSDPSIYKTTLERLLASLAESTPGRNGRRKAIRRKQVQADSPT